VPAPLMYTCSRALQVCASASQSCRSKRNARLTFSHRSYAATEVSRGRERYSVVPKVAKPVGERHSCCCTIEKACKWGRSSMASWGCVSVNPCPTEKPWATNIRWGLPPARGLSGNRPDCNWYKVCPHLCRLRPPPGAQPAREFRRCTWPQW
jgi:hypothetical protein